LYAWKYLSTKRPTPIPAGMGDGRILFPLRYLDLYKLTHVNGERKAVIVCHRNIRKRKKYASNLSKNERISFLRVNSFHGFFQGTPFCKGFLDIDQSDCYFYLD
jgi:hypothetical protein